MKTFTITTHKKREVLDITETINKKIAESGIDTGFCNVFVLHTTVALSTADLDPGTDLDMLDAFEAMVPKLNYRHPHDPGHVPDHILSTLIGTSLSLPVKGGKLKLGKWQRVVLFEFDGPQEREIVIG